jgi:hypothetical protein
MKRALIAMGVAAAAVAPAPAVAAAPKVHQLVVFRDGSFRAKTVSAGRASVKVNGRRCAVAPATPLAALLKSRPPTLRLKDFGSCSKRARDSAGLFVNRIGRDVNAGQDGWVYKVGNRSGSAGAADPTGPFGNGRLRNGARVVWFYCHMQGSTCQRTLAFTKLDTNTPGVLLARVKAYDDRGKGIPAAGVTVHLDGTTGTTDASGSVRIAAPGGRHRLYADGGGYVRSFDTRVAVR